MLRHHSRRVAGRQSARDLTSCARKGKPDTSLAGTTPSPQHSPSSPRHSRRPLVESSVARVSSYNGFTLDHAKEAKIAGSTFDMSSTSHSSADLLQYARTYVMKLGIYASGEP
ncbi:hypothetical protein PIB30_093995 [Stylosanthes scabra]|uniref:Uncharacterized protein n=1 Tax=Stylosanthes scabra TaxID=79078 RepID=A0ABU6QWH1_9FABA|nr:hypothetical protein [Stylosanthes scabra]